MLLYSPITNDVNSVSYYQISIFSPLCLDIELVLGKLPSPIKRIPASIIVEEAMGKVLAADT